MSVFFALGHYLGIIEVFRIPRSDLLSAADAHYR